MFLIDSITNRRSTEPIWFRFFRGFFAIIITGIIMYYLITQYGKIGTEASTIILLKSFASSELNMTMRTGTPNINFNYLHDPHDYDVNNQDISLNYTNDNYSPSSKFRFNINTNNANSSTQQYMDNILFLRFTSFQFYTPDNDKPDDKTYKTYDIESRQFPLYLGQAYNISIEPTIKNFIFDIGTQYDKLDLNLRLEQYPIKLKSNEIQIEIYSRSNPCILKNEMTRQYDITDFISSLGGFYGVIAGIFVLFFGMDKHEPWGLAQKYIFICTPCRRSLKRKFAKKYVSSAGIPLVEEINEPKEVKESGESLKENVEYLKGRVQILEALLEDYYLDAYYLKRVKKVITKHTKQEDLLEKYNQNKNEAGSIDKKSESKDEKAESKDETDTIVEVH